MTAGMLLLESRRKRSTSGNIAACGQIRLKTKKLPFFVNLAFNFVILDGRRWMADYNGVRF